MIVMFLPKTAAKETSASANTAAYVPGVYTTSLIINDNVVDVEVTVDENNINDIQIVNLDEAVTTMFPLIEPVFDDLAEKILKTQSLENITYADDNKYTSTVLLNAIKASLQKASPSPSASEDPCRLRQQVTGYLYRSERAAIFPLQPLPVLTCYFHSLSSTFLKSCTLLFTCSFL